MRQSWVPGASQRNRYSAPTMARAKAWGVRFRVAATIIPAGDADAGDYNVDISATVPESSAEFRFRITLERSSTFGFLGIAVVVLLIAFFFFRLLMRSVSKRGSYEAVEATAGGALAAGAPLALPGGRRALTALPQPTEQQDTRSEVEQRVVSMAQNQPEEVAQVVQAWLRDE